MKKRVFLTIVVCLTAAFELNAQTQVDHSIQLTGAGSNAEITGLKTIANGEDAVNDSSVQRDIMKYALATGSGTSGSPYSVTLNPALLAGYTGGMMVYFKAPVACTAGPVYININGLGSKTIVENGSATLNAGDIALNQLVDIQYDGTNFEMQSQLGNISSPGLFAHYIGELYGGGIVVAIWDSSGYERGLIASLYNIADSVGWTNHAYISTACGGTSPSNGMANTLAILAQGSIDSGAAYLCQNYNGGGYTDWYLPSVYELEQIFTSALVINKVLGDPPTGGGLLLINGVTSYWSSTEVSTTNAWHVANGIPISASKSTYLSQTARAVRRY